MPSNRLLKAVTQAAEIIAIAMRTITSRGGVGGYPKEVPESITVGTAQQSGDNVSIEIATENKGANNASIALAFELGSGLTGENRQRYRIEPKNKQALAFLWPEAEKINPGDSPAAPVIGISKKTGKAVLPYVMHPGIRPVPFVDDSIDASITEVTNLIADSMVLEIDNALGPKKITIP